jgi:hypothetical protein
MDDCDRDCNAWMIVTGDCDAWLIVTAIVTRG